MSRITRKNWAAENFNLVTEKGLHHLFDNAIKLQYRITDEEYDEMAFSMNEQEMELFVQESLTFSDKRKVIHLLKKYVNYELQPLFR
jgi:hypothetical protein